jgi:dienelactone hydrolase
MIEDHSMRSADCRRFARRLVLALASVGAWSGIAARAHAEVKTQTVEYKEGATVLEGYFAYDDAFSGKRPGIIVAHEWMGLNDYAKRRARELAQLGYVAFALDIYGKGVRAKDPKEAGALATKYKSDRALLRARALAAFDTLAKHPRVDRKKLAAIGYCFGGTTVLELARSGASLAGIVSFHGGLDTPHPEDAKNIKGRVLVLTGADDPSVPPAAVTAFEDEMRQAKVDWQLVSYGNAVHAFTNPDSGHDPSQGHAYNEKADKRSWQAMKDFFTDLFGNGKAS